MRLEIILKPLQKVFAIPVNYNYPLSSAIYKIFFEGSPKFSRWLHDKGFISADGKKMKLFTFSRLFFTEFSLENEIIYGSNRCWLLFSSPLDYSIIQNFISGVINNRKIIMANSQVKSEFLIESINLVPAPIFNNEMNFIMLSPTISSTMIEKNGKLIEYYYRVNDEYLALNLIKNLKKKYELLYHKEYLDDIDMCLDQDYIKAKGGAEKVSKLITIMEDSKQETKAKGFMCPIRIIGSPDIIKVAYDCGIGQKNSMGFGMLDVIK